MFNKVLKELQYQNKYLEAQAIYKVIKVILPRGYLEILISYKYGIIQHRIYKNLYMKNNITYNFKINIKFDESKKIFGEIFIL